MRDGGGKTRQKGGSPGKKKEDEKIRARRGRSKNNLGRARRGGESNIQSRGTKGKGKGKNSRQKAIDKERFYRNIRGTNFLVGSRKSQDREDAGRKGRGE